MIQRAPAIVSAGALHSPAVSGAGLMFLSGIRARDFGGDVKAQMQDVLAQLEAQLSAVDSDASQILVAHVWLKDMRYFGAMNAVWNAWVAQIDPPARTCVSGELFRPDCLVEVVVIVNRA